MHREQILSMSVGMHIVEQKGIPPAGAKGNLALHGMTGIIAIIRDMMGGWDKF